MTIVSEAGEPEGAVTPDRIRLVQWTTGNISRAAVKGVLERPDLELVGVYAYSADKVGKDVGELCDLDGPLGVRATNDIDAILALKPDCVLYMPLHPDVDHLERLLRAGINNAQVRLADTYRLPFGGAGDGAGGAGFDVVLFHQVLHYLDDPGAAVAEAARVMAPGARLLAADFAPHALEFLRDEFAHRRLGFSDREVEGWFTAAGLQPRGAQTIAPNAGTGEKLTVKLWLAQKKKDAA